MMPVGQVASPDFQEVALSPYSGVANSAGQRVDNLLSKDGEAFPSIALDVADPESRTGPFRPVNVNRSVESLYSGEPSVYGMTLNVPGSGATDFPEAGVSSFVDTASTNQELSKLLQKSINLDEVVSQIDDPAFHEMLRQQSRQASLDEAISRIVDPDIHHSFTILAQWVKSKEDNRLTPEFSPAFPSWGVPEVRHFGDTGWSVSRQSTGAFATFEYGESEAENIVFELPLHHIDVVKALPLPWQEFYDTKIFSHPRYAKLLDRLQDSVAEHPFDYGAYTSDLFGSQEELYHHQVDNLLLILAYLNYYLGDREEFANYADFSAGLSDAYLAVFHADVEITLQGGSKHPRHVVDFKQLSDQNQQRNFSSKQLNRIKIEMIQREAAKAKAESERIGSASHSSRHKARTQKRKVQRHLKSLNIECQAGLRDLLNAPIQAMSELLKIPSSVNKVCDSITDIIDGNSDDICVKDVLRASTSAADQMKVSVNQACGVIYGQETQDFIRAGIGATNATTNAATTLTNAVENANDAVGSTIETASSIFKKITDLLEGLKKTLLESIPKLLVLTIITGFVYYMYTHIKSPLMRAGLLTVLSALVGPHAYSLVVEFFKADTGGDDGDGVEVQSGLDVPTVSRLVAMLLIGVTFNMRKPTTMTGLLAHMLITMVAVPRAIKGIEGFIEMVVCATELGVNAIRSWFKKPPIRLANRFIQEIGDLANRINTFQYLDLNGKTGLTATQRYHKWMSLYNEVTTFLNIHHDNRDLRTELMTLKATVLKMAQPLRQVVGVGAGYRVQPASLIIAGRPGIGKTTIVQSVALTLMKLCGELAEDASEKEAEQAVFTKPANSPFMDGYQDQFCYFIDDLFAIKPTPNMEGNSYADIMTMYGGFTTMLNMAECDKKGMFPFTSKLLLMTTNCTNLNQANATQILLSEEAFKRRIDFHVEIVVKPEFRQPNSHQLDYTKYAAEAERLEREGTHGLDTVPWHIWEYHEVEFGDASRDFTTPGKPLKEMIIRVAERIRRNKMYHAQQEKVFSKLVKAEITPDWSYESLINGGVQQQSGLDFGAGPSGFGPSCDVNSDDEDYQDASEEDIAGLAPDLVVTPDDFPLEIREPEPIPPEPIVYVMTQSELDAMKARIKEAIRKAYQKGDDDSLERNQAHNRAYFEWGCKEASQLLSPFVMVGVFVIARSAISLVVKLFKGIYRWVKEQVYGKDHVSQQSNMPRPRSVTFQQQMPLLVQSGEIPKPLWLKVYENTYKTVLDLGDKFGTLGQTLFLRDTLAVMPAHFLLQILEHLEDGTISRKTNVIFRSCKQEYHTYTISVEALTSYKRKVYLDRDLAFIYFDKAIKPHKDITHFILKKAEIDDMGGNAVRLDTARVDRDGQLLEFNDRETFFSPSVAVGKNPVKIGPTVHTRWLRYQAKTAKGDCGAILSLTDHSQHACRFVAGMHVGLDETTDRAYATPLDAEIVEEAARALKVVTLTQGIAEQSGWDHLGIETYPLEAMPFTDDNSDHFGSFEPYLEVSKGVSSPVSSNLIPTLIGKTEFFKEEIAGFYEGKVPDKLEVMKMGKYVVDGKVVYPMAEAMRPFAGNVRIIDQQKFGRAISVAMKPFNDASIDLPRRLLTFEEAVQGVPGLALKSIARQTSVGYPWSTATRNQDKSYFFGREAEYDLTTPEAKLLKQQVEGLIKLMERGVRPLFVARDFLKDEVRKEGKGARLIAGTDLRYYILCRMYFGTYVSGLMRMHRESGICTGMNPYSEWPWLHEHITKHGNKVWDGDFAGFDQSQQPSMLWPILTEINQWYSRKGGGADNAIREILFYDLAHSRHLCSKYGTATTVVEWLKSLPSGHFLTSVVNSILCLSLMAASFIALTGLYDFWKHASAATQGDDNLCGASDEVIGSFNQVTVAKYLAEEFDMVYTAGRKGEELKPFMKVEDVTFLQRKFLWKNDYMVCPIRPESFLHSLYFTKKGKSQAETHEIMISGLEEALQELSMHPEEKWGSVAPRIVEALELYQSSPELKTQDSTDYFEKVRSRVPQWL